MSWNPDQYDQFKAERRQPFVDLLALIERRPGMRVLDLGCGTGELTRELHEALGAQETLGIDNSEAMLAKAGALKTASGLKFRLADIRSFQPDAPFDLVFSNAALHWVRDHDALLRRLVSFLAPNGQLAIQMPANDDHPSHATAAEVAREFEFEPRHNPMLPIDDYARIIHSLGLTRESVRMQVYGHELESAASVIEWVKGTLLTDYQKRLGGQYGEFLARYTETLLARLGDSRPFFYTFKRVLIFGQNRV